MTFKVFIPAAGLGSRLGDLTQYLNKSLISIGGKPALSRIIEKFPSGTEFVIALGYKGDTIQQFISLAYPGLNVRYVTVDKFDGDGSGLGYTLSCCMPYLQCPFIFVACDTIVTNQIPDPIIDWVGYSIVENSDAYRTITLEEGNLVGEIYEKLNSSASNFAYIGLAGIKNYQQFWDSFISDRGCVEVGEVAGLRGLISGGIQAIQFDWLDTGTHTSLENARNRFKTNNDPVILDKGNEAIWFVGQRVIKYSADEKFIRNRVLRGGRLSSFVPSIIDSTANMYSYSMAPGDVFSRVVTLPLFDDFLNHSQKFWIEIALSDIDRVAFKRTCYDFYYNKTISRINDFYASHHEEDCSQSINGVNLPTLSSLLNQIDWDWLTDGSSARFHGDFHFENIIYDSLGKKFTFLDWRQDFGGDLCVGDVYYDLAKLMHGLIISHDLIKKNLFEITWNESQINFNFQRKYLLVECQKHYENWLLVNGYDIRKVYLLTALIYLNIAVLHHYPYSLLLYALGKTMLAEHAIKEH